MQLLIVLGCLDDGMVSIGHLVLIVKSLHHAPILNDFI